MYVLTSSTSSLVSVFVWVVIFCVVIFVFMLRPQRKEEKRKNEMMAGLAIGDTVLTTSGFYGTVIDIDEDIVIVEFGNNRNCRIPMSRQAIAQIEKPEDAVEE